MKEFWEADKLREVDSNLLSPMYARGLQHFYINELAQLCDGTYVIPLRWITVNGVVHGECVVVETIGSTVSTPNMDSAYIKFSLGPCCL